MDFVKIKGKYINIKEILHFEHIVDEDGDEQLYIRFKNYSNCLYIDGPKELLDEFAKKIYEALHGATWAPEVKL